MSDYRKEFPDFFLQSYTTMAPLHRFQRDADALEHVRDKVDSYLSSNGQDHLPTFSASDLFHMMPFKRRRGKQMPVKDILLMIQNQDHNDGDTKHLHDQLKNVTMKSLKFSEDVRPPYQGTFTRPVPERVANHLSRNPFSRALPNINYDYDSEAEWEEPEEGEELDTDEDEDMSEEGDDDMEGFVDDAEDYLSYRGAQRPVVGDMQPVCSGLCWEDENGYNPKLQAYRMESLLESESLSIDPFSSAYWYPEMANKTSVRSTLHAIAVTSSAHEITSSSRSMSAAAAAAAVPASSKVKRLLPAELMEAFKQVVEGSDLTKAGLVEILKKRYVRMHAFMKTGLTSDAASLLCPRTFSRTR